MTDFAGTFAITDERVIGWREEQLFLMGACAEDAHDVARDPNIELDAVRVLVDKGATPAQAFAILR